MSVIAGSSLVQAAEQSYGADAAATDTQLSVADMLQYAIQDEYLAQAEYAAIMEEFGPQRPFTNIIRAEATHISALLPLFETYDVSVPTNDAAGHVVLPDTLAEIFETGVVAEQKNIAMYQRFLAEDLPEDVQVVFASLLQASENHLRAFEQAGSIEPNTAGTAARGSRGNRNQVMAGSKSMINPDPAVNPSSAAEPAGNANRFGQSTSFGQGNRTTAGRTVRQAGQRGFNFRTSLCLNPEVA
jgi:hypothetical protein